VEECFFYIGVRYSISFLIIKPSTVNPPAIAGSFHFSQVAAYLFFTSSSSSRSSTLASIVSTFFSILLSVEISNGCAEHKAAPSHVFVDRDIFG